MNTENRKTNELHKFKLRLADKLTLKDNSKNMALANLSLYYTWKTLNQHTTTINLKFMPQLWNDKCNLPYGSYSILQTCKTTLNL